MYPLSSRSSQISHILSLFVYSLLGSQGGRGISECVHFHKRVVTIGFDANSINKKTKTQATSVINIFRCVFTFDSTTLLLGGGGGDLSKLEKFKGNI